MATTPSPPGCGGSASATGLRLGNRARAPYNTPMDPAISTTEPHPPEASPARSTSSGDTAAARPTALWGILLCIAAALGYSVANACLRKLSVDCDQVLVVFVKELIAVGLVGPWLAWHAWHGRRTLPGGRALAALAVMGLLTQVVGNVPAVWAFGVIGLAVAMPLMSGTNLVAAVILSRIFLGERVSSRTVLAISLLSLSFLLLLLAAPQATRTIRGAAPATTDWGIAALAVGATCLAGMVYAMLVVVVRRTATGNTPTTAIVFMITGMAVVSLGPWLAVRRGPETLLLLDVPPVDVGLMLLAGVLNLLAFLALTKGLQWTPVARANMIMTSQVVLGALVGVTLFGEPGSLWLILGLCLTIAGMTLIGREMKVEPETTV